MQGLPGCLVLHKGASCPCRRQILRFWREVGGYPLLSSSLISYFLSALCCHWKVKACPSPASECPDTCKPPEGLAGKRPSQRCVVMRLQQVLDSMCACIYIYTHIHIRIHIQVKVRIHMIYIYIYIYIHTYLHVRAEASERGYFITNGQGS